MIEKQSTVWNYYKYSPFNLPLSLGHSYRKKLEGQKSLNRILFEIKHGRFKDLVTRIRQFIAEGKAKEAQVLKKQLLAFCASVTFDRHRNIERINQRYNLVVLDVDHVKHYQLDDLRHRINQIPNTISSFLSPSGMGFKILCEVDNRNDFYFHHVYTRVVRYYEELLSIDFDDSTNDETRLCYYSFDTQLYINPNFESITV